MTCIGEPAQANDAVFPTENLKIPYDQGTFNVYRSEKVTFEGWHLSTVEVKDYNIHFYYNEQLQKSQKITKFNYGYPPNSGMSDLISKMGYKIKNNGWQLKNFDTSWMTVGKWRVVVEAVRSDNGKGYKIAEYTMNVTKSIKTNTYVTCNDAPDPNVGKTHKFSTPSKVSYPEKIQEKAAFNIPISGWIIHDQGSSSYYYKVTKAGASASVLQGTLNACERPDLSGAREKYYKNGRIHQTVLSRNGYSGSIPTKSLAVGSYSAYIYVKTCDGTDVMICQIDFKVYTKCEATGHKYTKVTKAATCTENGYTVEQCSVCKKEKPNSKVTIEKTGHKWGDWVTKQTYPCVDGTKSRKCEKCKKTETQVAKATQAHKFQDRAILEIDASTHQQYCDTCKSWIKDLPHNEKVYTYVNGSGDLKGIHYHICEDSSGSRCGYFKTSYCSDNVTKWNYYYDKFKGEKQVEIDPVTGEALYYQEQYYVYVRTGKCNLCHANVMQYMMLVGERFLTPDEIAANRRKTLIGLIPYVAPLDIIDKVCSATGPMSSAAEWLQAKKDYAADYADVNTTELKALTSTNHPDLYRQCKEYFEGSNPYRNRHDFYKDSKEVKLNIINDFAKPIRQ
ncbi:MAG: hypothetical protein IK081_08515 [Lachnospiraceae bacterium]|nr:hypothetical protein [Lachnospiraceae bacterium]